MGVVASVEKVLSGDARNDGIFYSTIDDVWKAISAGFCAADWQKLRRTPSQVHRIPPYGPIIDGMNVDDDPALGSSRSESMDSNIPDLKGTRSKIAQGAHFVPHKTFAVAFGPVAEMALGQNLEGDDNRTRKRHRLVVGVLETRGKKRQKRENTGLKHCVLNKVRIKGQKEYMDNRPCLLIVPLLSLDETKGWKRGEAYSALLCAGGYNGGGHLTVSSADVYQETCIEFLPRCTRQDLVLATDLLAFFTKGLAQSLATGECFDDWNTNPAERTKLENVRDKLTQINRVHIPHLNDTNLFQPLRVAKISFDADNEALPNPPDPYLLVVKAAIIWSWRNEEKLLPGCFIPEDEECSECDRIREYEERLREEQIRPSDHMKIAKGLGLDVDETTVFKLE